MLHIGQGISGRCRVKLYANNPCNPVALGCHQGYQTTAAPNIKYAISLTHIGPCAEQYAVRAHLHGAVRVVYMKLFETETHCFVYIYCV